MSTPPGSTTSEEQLEQPAHAGIGVTAEQNGGPPNAVSAAGNQQALQAASTDEAVLDSQVHSSPSTGSPATNTAAYSNGTAAPPSTTKSKPASMPKLPQRTSKSPSAASSHTDSAAQHHAPKPASSSQQQPAESSPSTASSSQSAANNYTKSTSASTSSKPPVKPQSKPAAGMPSLPARHVSSSSNAATNTSVIDPKETEATQHVRQKVHNIRVALIRAASRLGYNHDNGIVKQVQGCFDANSSRQLVIQALAFAGLCRLPLLKLTFIAWCCLKTASLNHNLQNSFQQRALSLLQHEM